MKSVLNLLKRQIRELGYLENDLEVICKQIKDDRLYLEQEIENHENNGNIDEANRYYEELDILVAPVRRIESDIRKIKVSIIEDYAELILTTVGNVDLANSIEKSKRNYVQSERIIEALRRKFN